MLLIPGEVQASLEVGVFRTLSKALNLGCEWAAYQQVIHCLHCYLAENTSSHRDSIVVTICQILHGQNFLVQGEPIEELNFQWVGLFPYRFVERVFKLVIVQKVQKDLAKKRCIFVPSPRLEGLPLLVKHCGDSCVEIKEIVIECGGRQQIGLEHREVRILPLKKQSRPSIHRMQSHPFIYLARRWQICLL